LRIGGKRSRRKRLLGGRLKMGAERHVAYHCKDACRQAASA